MPPFFDYAACLPRVKAMQAPLLVLAENLCQARRFKLAVLVYRLDAWGWWLRRAFQLL